MRRYLSIVLAVVSLLFVMPLASAQPGDPAGAQHGYQHLNPAGPADFREEVGVNVVFVGYEPEDVDADGFLGGLPQTYQPINRVPSGYLPSPEVLGIDYTYRYDLTYADKHFEDRFFAELARLAVPSELTLFQQQYNAQDTNVLDVAGNHHIDAPSVERWLATNAPRGVDTKEPTIFFVNWYGREDFVHHVYTKTDEPDPDTGYNFGELRESRKMIAWGGTAPDDEQSGYGRVARVWFYDLSAGPEAWTENWNVDSPDLDDDGVEDYRMPPIWEYTEGGYREPAALTGDLAKVARYTAINLLFTTSPLYRADLTPLDLPKTINLDSNTYEGWEGVDASETYITPDLLVSNISALRPLNIFDYDNQDFAFDGDIARCYELAVVDERCYPELAYPPFANFFLSNAFNLERTQDDGANVDYELPNFNYAVGDEETYPPPALGFADDNYRDGTQSFVFNFVSPGIVEAGYGLTTTMIHEVGHHLALSHPHDGWDSEEGIEYTAFSNEFLFVNSGDQSNSMMSYIDVNWDFSQFDRDNSNRFLAEGYTRNANAIAGLILDAGTPDRLVGVALRSADRLVGLSERAFGAHQYDAAAHLAEGAYRLVRRAADRAGVEVPRSTAGWEVDLSTPAEPGGEEKLPFVFDGPEARRYRDLP